MKETLKLLKYNNYFNRIIKKAGDSAADYASYVLHSQDLVNFNPNDGVNAEVIINSEEQGDYMLVVDEDGAIKSRWFVTECARTRAGQSKLTLRRDVLTDNFEKLKSSKAFINRGVITDIENPLIYNSEHAALNQIKKEEILLKDATGCPWLVGYLAKGSLGSDHSGSVNWDPGDGDYIEISTTIENWAYARYTDVSPMKVATDVRWAWKWMKIVNPGSGSVSFRSSVNENGPSTKTYSPGIGQYSNLFHAVGGFWQNDNDANNAVGKPIATYIENNGLFETLEANTDELLNFQSKSTMEEFLSLYDGKIIKDSAGKYFKVKSSKTTRTGTKANTPVSTGSLYTTMKNIWNGALDRQDDPNEFALEVTAETVEELVVTLIPQPNLAAQFSLNGTFNVTDDPLYDIICVPYGKIDVYTENNHFTTNESTSLIVMNGMATSLTDSVFKDLQLLPYCPVIGYWDGDRMVVSDDRNIIMITQQGQNEYPVIIAKSSVFSTTVNEEITIDRPYKTRSRAVSDKIVIKTTNLPGNIASHAGVIDTGLDAAEVTAFTVMVNGATKSSDDVTYSVQDGKIIYEVFRLPTRPFSLDNNIVARAVVNGLTYIKEYDNDIITDIKLSNECDMYRLCSPNGNGAFEFSVAKNNKQIDYFKADCSYKPYNPYIRVAPNFSGLYGADFNDFRGLICGGEFSLGILNSAWNQYELQNRNFQNIFDRQMQNMEVNHKYDMINAGFGALTGTMTGAMSGAAAGAMAGGGPYSAAIGAAVGGVSSAAGGVADMIINQKRYLEGRDMAQDMFRMNLDNVKALPTTITRTSALTANNKKFPFVERYTCTDEEKRLLKNKLEMQGMTIGAMDDLSNWIGQGHYVQAYIVRNEEIADDTHMLETINEELNKGVYL